MKEYNINFSDPNEGAKEMIMVWIEQLEGFRFTTSQPKELEWELGLYRFMLNDPAVRLDQYREARHLGSKMVSKREAVKSLGWEI